MNNKRISGFTLVELMVTVSIVALVLTMGVPSFQSSVRANRLTTTANEFLAALSFARSEAVKRGISVTLCKSVDKDVDAPNYLARCSTATTGYESGWIVFVDYDGKGSIDASKNIDGTAGSEQDAVIRVHDEMPGDLALASEVPGDSQEFISYQPNGSLSRALEFTICSPPYARKVYVTKAGRPHIADTDSSGTALTCS